MNNAKRFACLLALAAAFAPCRLVAEEDELADTPAVEKRVGDDENQRYLLIEKKETAPDQGYGLLVVLPGGDGSAEFSSFVRRIRKYALPAGYLIAEPIAPMWTANQQATWPTKKLRVPGMKFTTEEFVAAVIDDVAAKEKLDPARVFVLGWSSGGPPAYAATCANPKVRGAFVAMSVFKPDQMPLGGAKEKAFYVYHSPDDRMIPIRFAEQAVKDLEKHGAKAILKTYPGGQGWQSNVYPDQRAGIEWLETNATAPPAAKR